jgi:hypothetical protein
LGPVGVRKGEQGVRAAGKTNRKSARETGLRGWWIVPAVILGTVGWIVLIVWLARLVLKWSAVAGTGWW